MLDLGEEMGLEPGSSVTGKMVAALRRLGFDSVLDTDFTADLTIIEEGHELLTRLKKVLVDKDESVKLPMATSCSPGWIKYIEHMYPGPPEASFNLQIAATNVWCACKNILRKSQKPRS